MSHCLATIAIDLMISGVRGWVILGELLRNLAKEVTGLQCRGSCSKLGAQSDMMGIVWRYRGVAGGRELDFRRTVVKSGDMT